MRILRIAPPPLKPQTKLSISPIMLQISIFPQKILTVDCLAGQSDLSPLPDHARPAQVNPANSTDVKEANAVNEDHISKEMVVSAGNIDLENHVNAGNILLVNPLNLSRGNSVLYVLARVLLLREGRFN